MTATTTTTAATLDVVKRLEAAFNSHDVDAQLACFAEGGVFEIVAPAEKGGARFEGQEAIRGIFSSLPQLFPGYSFETEDIFAIEDRCCYRWTLRFDIPGGTAIVHGVDVYTVYGGKIAEKLSYFTA